MSFIKNFSGIKMKGNMGCLLIDWNMILKTSFRINDYPLDIKNSRMRYGGNIVSRTWLAFEKVHCSQKENFDSESGDE